MAGNTQPIGLHPPKLTDVRVVKATRNKAGVYVTLTGTFWTTSPDLGCKLSAPVEFKVSLDKWTPEEWDIPTEQQYEDARDFFTERMVEDAEHEMSLPDLYNAYMQEAGTAKRAIFHATLRDEFAHMMGPPAEGYRVGASLLIRGWRVGT